MRMLVAAAVLVTGSPSLAQDTWVKVATASSGDIYYISLEGAKRAGSKARLWRKTEYLRPVPGTGTTGYTSLVVVDCDDLSTKGITTNYMKGDDVSWTDSKPHDIEYPVPGSVLYKVNETVCEVVR